VLRAYFFLEIFMRNEVPVFFLFECIKKIFECIYNKLFFINNNKIIIVIYNICDKNNNDNDNYDTNNNNNNNNSFDGSNLMHVLLNAQFSSVLHRVVMEENQQRLSSANFYFPPPS
jgi:hypothetical protein